MEKSAKNTKKEILIFAVVFVTYCLITVPLLPFGDDWTYLTSPHCLFKLTALLPGAVSWRPLDSLFGAFLGLAPSLFPFANHVAVAFGHVLGGYFTYRILLLFFDLNKKGATVATGFFLFAAGTFTAVASVDSLNQIYSSTFGIIAFYCFILFKECGKRPYYILYVLLCFLAAFSKENGLMWFAVIPFLYSYEWLISLKKNFLSAHQTKLFGTVKYISFGLVFCAVYFALRFAVRGSVELGASEGPYQMTLSLSTIKRLATLIGSAFTFIDSVALFATPRNYILLVISILLSLPFLLWLTASGIKALRNKDTCLRLVIILIASFLMTLPNIVTTVGEMHAYLLMFFAALLIGFFLKNAFYSGKRIIAVFLITALLSTTMVNVHKWMCLYETSLKTRVVNDVVRKAYAGEKAPDNVLLIKVMDEKKGYSLFVQPVAFSSYYGYSARDLWNWKHPANMRAVEVENISEKDKAIKSALATDDSYDAIWVIRANGDCEIIKR